MAKLDKLKFCLKSGFGGSYVVTPVHSFLYLFLESGVELGTSTNLPNVDSSLNILDLDFSLSAKATISHVIVSYLQGFFGLLVLILEPSVSIAYTGLLGRGCISPTGAFRELGLGLSLDPTFNVCLFVFLLALLIFLPFFVCAINII